MARMQARLMDFVPGKPFSTDNYLSLQVDNVSVENCLWRYGIEPREIAEFRSEVRSSGISSERPSVQP